MSPHGHMQTSPIIDVHCLPITRICLNPFIILHKFNLLRYESLSDDFFPFSGSREESLFVELDDFPEKRACLKPTEE